MATILDAILSEKKIEVEKLQRNALFQLTIITHTVRLFLF